MTPQQREALAELAQKSCVDIQVETAWKWAHRAWAAYRYAALAREQGDNLRAGEWVRDALDHGHEAVEHAALSGNDTLLAEVRVLIESGK